MIEISELRGDEGAPLFRSVETVHRRQLTAGALAHMPTGFLARFYRHLASETASCVFVARENGRLIGFVSGSLRASGLLRRFIAAHPFTVAADALRLLRHPLLACRVMKLTAFMSRRSRASDAAGPQLLSIAVESTEVRKRVGEALFFSLTRWFESNGIAEFAVIASETQTAALEFYRRLGGRETADFDLGGLKSVEFVFRLPGGGRP